VVLVQGSGDQDTANEHIVIITSRDGNNWAPPGQNVLTSQRINNNDSPLQQTLAPLVDHIHNNGNVNKYKIYNDQPGSLFFPTGTVINVPNQASAHAKGIVFRQDGVHDLENTLNRFGFYSIPTATTEAAGISEGVEDDAITVQSGDSGEAGENFTLYWTEDPDNDL